jgi:polyphosphate glucokinase
VPEAVAAVVARIAAHFACDGPVGVTFPAPVKAGVTLSAANVDPAWIGMDAAELFRRHLDGPVVVLNDADAAGIAEMCYGAGRGARGTVIMLTFGTGIGSAVFHDGVLLPNSEFGHLKIRGKDAEDRCSARVREDKDLSFKAWSVLVAEFLNTLDVLFSPELFIIGGGISKRADKFLPHLSRLTPVPLAPAALLNEAGIIGAAHMAAALDPNKAATANATQ